MQVLWDPVFLSRLQFGLTTAFHICWASLSVGVSFFLVLVEGLWLKTGNRDYYGHTRFWGRFFLLVFILGVVSGIPLSFQFGTNWEKFSIATGGFFGHLLGFEATMAFMLESAFLGIMLAGWGRVSRGVHFLSTVMVFLGASLSVFWIMVANSWMQVPAGGAFKDGRFVLESYTKALFNPDWFLGFSHMWAACVESSFFLIGGISAWKILTRQQPSFFLKSFKIAVAAAIIVAPAQFLLGDESGRLIADHQPAKLAATEAHWETNRPGEDAGWNLVAWPNRRERKNDFQIRIPFGLSLLITRSLHGQVRGLEEFPRDEQPPILIPFYAFRVMLGIGFGMIFLAVWTVWLWFKGRLALDRITEQKKMLFFWVLTVPLGYVAIVTGWVVREVGRQPWVVYGLVRTTDGATPLSAAAVAPMVLIYLIVYTALFFLFLGMAGKIVGRGPDPEEVSRA